MRDLFIVLFVLAALTGCKKEAEPVDAAVLQVYQDSLVRTVQGKWKFTVAIENPVVSTKLSNWEEWRNFVNELIIAPDPSVSHLQHKAGNLVQNTALLRNNIPELYNRQETAARIGLLETNVQNLDMHLDLEPINQTEVLRLLANIQKNTTSLIHQFDEFEVKARIPREEGESQLIHSIDTVKRATLNALPQE